MPVSDSAASPAPSATDDDLGDLLLELLPPDGSAIGNGSAREALSRAAETTESSEEATAYTRSSKPRVGRGRISVRGWR